VKEEQQIAGRRGGEGTDAYDGEYYGIRGKRKAGPGWRSKTKKKEEGWCHRKMAKEDKSPYRQKEQGHRLPGRCKGRRSGRPRIKGRSEGTGGRTDRWTGTLQKTGCKAGQTEKVRSTLYRIEGKK